MLADILLSKIVELGLEMAGPRLLPLGSRLVAQGPGLGALGP